MCAHGLDFDLEQVTGFEGEVVVCEDELCDLGKELSELYCEGGRNLLR